MAKGSSNSSVAGTGPITKRKCHRKRIKLASSTVKSMLDIKYEGGESAKAVLLLYWDALWFQGCQTLRDDCPRWVPRDHHMRRMKGLKAISFVENGQSKKIKWALMILLHETYLCDTWWLVILCSAKWSGCQKKICFPGIQDLWSGWLSPHLLLWCSYEEWSWGTWSALEPSIVKVIQLFKNPMCLQL